VIDITRTRKLDSLRALGAVLEIPAALVFLVILAVT